MRITLEIDSDDMKQIQKITGQKKKSLAIGRALADFLRMWERRTFIEKALVGQTDYTLTNEELEALDVHEIRSFNSLLEFLGRMGDFKIKQKWWRKIERV